MNFMKDWLFIYCSLYLNGVSCYNLILTNDGPVVTDTPITFTATLEGAYPAHYAFIFEDRTLKERQEIDSVKTAKAVYIFKSADIQPPRRFNTMSVQVWFTYFGIKAWIAAESEMKFELSDNLIGTLNVTQHEVPSDALSNSIVATDRVANMTVGIRDPSNYLKRNSNYTFMWSIDGISSENNMPFLLYNFTNVKSYNVTVIVIAKFNSLQKKNNFEMIVKAKERIRNVTLLGNTWLNRDKNLDLRVNCLGGSSPYFHCYNIYLDNSTTNSSCSFSTIYTDTCSFNALHYFRNKGSYFLYIKMGNEVTIIEKFLEINVFDITHQPQLSFVIIPVVSCILAVLIIVVGVAYHMKQRDRQAVEVADFDFQYNDLNEKTFIERVMASISKSFQRNGDEDHSVNVNQVHDFDELIDNELLDDTLESSPITSTVGSSLRIEVSNSSSTNQNHC